MRNIATDPALSFLDYIEALVNTDEGNRGWAIINLTAKKTEVEVLLQHTALGGLKIVDVAYRNKKDKVYVQGAIDALDFRRTKLVDYSVARRIKLKRKKSFNKPTFKKTVFKDLPFKGVVTIQIIKMDIKANYMVFTQGRSTYKTAIPKREGFEGIQVGDRFKVEVEHYMGQRLGQPIKMARMIRKD